jgi:hypothetical protein
MYICWYVTQYKYPLTRGYGTYKVHGKIFNAQWSLSVPPDLAIKRTTHLVHAMFSAYVTFPYCCLNTVRAELSLSLITHSAMNMCAEGTSGYFPHRTGSTVDSGCSKYQCVPQDVQSKQALFISLRNGSAQSIERLGYKLDNLRFDPVHGDFFLSSPKSPDRLSDLPSPLSRVK